MIIKDETLVPVAHHEDGFVVFMSERGPRAAKHLFWMVDLEHTVEFLVADVAFALETGVGNKLSIRAPVTAQYAHRRLFLFQSVLFMIHESDFLVASGE